MSKQYDPADLTREDAEMVVIDAEPLGAPVDQPDRKATFADIVSRRENIRPIVPATLRSPRDAADLARWATRFAGHRALYHLTRSPKYAVKVAWWAPIGVFRAAFRLAKWASAEEGNYHLRQQAATRNDPATWLQLDARRQKQSSWRWPLAIAAYVGAVAATLAVVVVPSPVWVPWVALVAATAVFARLGRPLDKPIVDRVLVGTRFTKLTAELTRAAIMATGKVKDPGGVTFLRDIYRDPPGQTAEVQLPDTVTAEEVIDRRANMAAGLRLPIDQVWPEPMPAVNPSALRIWVADRPVNSMRRPAWAWIDGDKGRADFWGEIPYGYDVRLRPVSLRLAERNSLFAGVPGSGKTLAARNLLLGAILDPLVVPIVSELKGSGDFDPVRDLCPDGMYISGADDMALDRTMDLLAWLDRECDKRGPLIHNWVAKGFNTDNKLNRRIAEADARLRPLVVVLDEIQELFGDPDRKKEAIRLVTSIVKRGRSLGIHLILASQRIDKESVPKGISSNVVNRVCLAVASHVEVDLVLGTGAYARGARPTDFMPPPFGANPWAGWGFLAGVPLAAAYVDNNGAKKVVALAKQRRDGTPDIDVTRVPAYNLLADVRQVWPATETALWLEILVDLLAKLRPEVYGAWDVQTLGKNLRSAGLDVVQVKRKLDSGKDANRYGVRRDALAAAIAARESHELGRAS